MTHQQAADPAALEVLCDGEGQFGATPCGGDGAAGEIARPADDDLVLARADSYQQRDRSLEICPRDPTEFSVTDIGLITKEPRVDRAVAGTSSFKTLRWREMNSNHRYPAKFLAAPVDPPQFTFRNINRLPRDRN